MAALCDHEAVSLARCKIRACDLRHSIKIETFIRTRQAGGGGTRAWSTFVSARACIEPMRGRELLHAMQLQDSVTHKITMRYRSGVIAKMRVKFGTRIFNIRAVINIDERNKWSELMCEEGVAT